MAFLKGHKSPSTAWPRWKGQQRGRSGGPLPRDGWNQRGPSAGWLRETSGGFIFKAQEHRQGHAVSFRLTSPGGTPRRVNS